MRGNIETTIPIDAVQLCTAAERRPRPKQTGEGGRAMGTIISNFKMNHSRYRMRYNCVDELLAVACLSKLKGVHSKINKMSEVRCTMHGTTSLPFDASTFAQLRVSSLFVANGQNAIKPIWRSNVVP